ncbi:phosphatidate cytidylyltransferase [Salinarimonas soli]|uniref:Phosphatidate cytidylyltransferase n=1 Tax=Salinarimonas soli TaxID=1638099 RepID=A0A5B2VFE2_9HYPH|nr:phosphatidate cytidylyltransferase [Salinarimonas soli]KAA2238273.1 phosphatidate cytidylyltransferase [Salinarimonas soli]
MTAHALALFAAVVGVLTTASLVGLVLRRRAALAGPNPTIENLNARIRAWWVMVAVLGGAFALGKAGLVLVFAFASFTALREYMTLTRTRRGDHYALGAVFFVILPAQYWLVWTEWYGLMAVFIPVYAFLLLPIAAALRGDATNFLDRVAAVQWGLMICVFCLSHVPALGMLDIPGYEGRSLLLVVFLILVVQMSDVLQYVCGKIWGRTPVAPVLSPSKTWEGLIGGGAGAMLIGTALWWATPFSPLQACWLAGLVTLMGFLGGLVMSAIKRDRGVKDWGHLIEGHGGVLDRLDSVVFSAPIFFHVVRYGWTV